MIALGMCLVDSVDSSAAVDIASYPNTAKKTVAAPVNAPERPNGKKGFQLPESMWNTPTTITTSTMKTLRYTSAVSKRAAFLMPRLRTNAMSRHRTTANRLILYDPCATPSGSVPGAPDIHSGSLTSRNPSRSLKYPEIPMATTATMAVYTSSRSQPMNQPTTSPRTA